MTLFYVATRFAEFEVVVGPGFEATRYEATGTGLEYQGGTTTTQVWMGTATDEMRVLWELLILLVMKLSMLLILLNLIFKSLIKEQSIWELLTLIKKSKSVS